MSGPPPAAEPAGILGEGTTCWKVEVSDRTAVLIDGAAYFEALLGAFRLARERIVVLGWDFDARVRLDPNDPETELRRLLPALAAERPGLEIYVLVWDVSVLFGPSSPVAALIDRDWHAHPRIHLRFDSNHPAGAAHHEKIVCVDDTLAFVGGIDLTVARWDTPQHPAADERRLSPDGAQCPPVHDLQMAVAGDAARAVAELARARWTGAGGAALAPCSTLAVPWPPSAEVWLAGAPVGIARTRPPVGGSPAVAEVTRLNDAALSAARRFVYIETQYLCAPAVAARLEDLLRRDHGPEVVILAWQETTGWLERHAMGGNRDRLLRRLAAVDRHGRLRVYRLTAGDDPEREVKLHAKLLIVDDRFFRIGSSNLNNRSLGVDTECDLAIEASDDAGRAAVNRLRNTLLAEHLGRSPVEIDGAVAELGLVGMLERFGGAPGGRPGRLRPYRLEPADEPLETVPGTSLIDPEEPMDEGYLLRALRDRLLPG